MVTGIPFSLCNPDALLKNPGCKTLMSYCWCTSFKQSGHSLIRPLNSHSMEFWSFEVWTILFKLMDVRENFSTSLVSEIFRPAYRVPIPMWLLKSFQSPFFHILMLICTSAGHLDQIFLSKCTEILPCGWLTVHSVCVNEWQNSYSCSTTH